ncbi:MBL fold metallo-hydrolase [Tepidibacillus decaturensis]|uniref:Metallo-beta-lactamase domain-containing protein n=1 Tax=Tepidibacillus decaturensis TaxID=1413211 RepID=A0A135L4S9_9BACI|nr:MBL fold metallo-hydrolase [Tepidibacillus decaturensis]KXG43971.1 hypothetical protein U473_08090 [Tepidibacillus decaturensis]
MNRLQTNLENQNIKLISLNLPTPFPVGDVHAYLLLGDKITLIDAGIKTEQAWKSLIYQINENGIRLKDIDQVLLTHHHVDHIGLLDILRQHHSKLKVYAHQWTIPWVEKEPIFNQQLTLFYEKLYLENGLSKDQVQRIKSFNQYLNQFMDPVSDIELIEDGSSLPHLPNWKVLHTPGHSQGHIVLYHEKKGILIAGDFILENTSSGIFVEPILINNLFSRAKSGIDYLHSLEKIKGLKIEKVYSGHGKVIVNLDEMIDRQFSRFKQRSEQLKEILEQGSFTVYDLMRKVYPNRYEKHLNLFFSEILSFLDYLEYNGEISSFRQDHLIKYQLKM